MERKTTHTLPPDIQQKLKDLRDFVVLDVETTGFDNRKNHVIEIGMIKVEDGKEVAIFSSFINPGTPIPTHITNLTGITDADVQSAPHFDEIANEIVAFMGDAILVGHNVQFDIGFMRSEFMHCCIRKDFHYVDTLFLARKAFPALKSHKLSNLIVHLGFEETQSHRALDDARWTLKVLTTICDRYVTPSLDDTIKACKSHFSTRRTQTNTLKER